MSKKDEYISLVDYHLSRMVDIGAIDENGRSYALTEFAKTPEENMESYADDLINEIERIVTVSLAKMQGLDTLAEDVIVHTIISQTAKNQQEQKTEQSYLDQNQKLYNIGTNRNIQPGQVLQLSDLINPNAGLQQNQPQTRTTFAQSASLANESKDSSGSETNYSNLPPLNSTNIAPPIQKVPFPTQAQSNVNYPNPAFQPNFTPSSQPVQIPYPNQQQAQSVQNSGQYQSQAQPMPYYPVSNTAQAQSYPQAPIPSPRPAWRPGSNLVKPPSNSN